MSRDDDSDIEDERSANNEALLHLIRKNADLTDIEGAFTNEGVNVNYQNVNKDTPLHLAVRKANKDHVQFLVEKGANDIRNKKNKTALDLAEEKHKKCPDDNNWTSICNLLEQQFLINKRPADDDIAYSPSKKAKLDNTSNDIQQAIPSTSRQETSDLNKEEKLYKAKSQNLSIMDGDSGSEPFQPAIPSTSRQEEKLYKARSVKCSPSGRLYEYKIASLISKRAAISDHKFKFLMATEMVSAGYLDDLMFANLDEKKVHLHQIKSSSITGNKVTKTNLTTPTDGDYSLQKYFVSFCKIDLGKEKYLQGMDLEDFNIITNIGYEEDQCKDLLEAEDMGKNDILYIGQKEKKLRIKENCKKDVNFHLIFKLPILKRALEVKFINGNTNNSDPGDFDGVKKFLENKFRGWMLKKKGNNLSSVARDMNATSDDGINKLRQIEGIFKGYKENIEDSNEIDKIVEKLNKMNLNITKTEIKHIPKTISDAKRASCKLIDREYETARVILKLALDDSEFQKRIEKFIEKFSLIVDYPNNEQLREIIKIELGEKFLLLNADLVSDSFEKQMLDWFGYYKDGHSKFLERDAVNRILDEIENDINTLLTTGLNTAFPEKLRNYHIKFDSTTPSFLTFKKDIQNFLKDQSKLILYIKSKKIRLTSIKLLQILEEIGEFKKLDSYIFVKLETLLLEGVQKLVNDSFSSGRSHNVLIVECLKELQQELQNFFQDFKELDKNKKIIIIAHDCDVLCNKFKENISFLEDTSVFADLDTDSQRRLLNNTRVILQIEDPSKKDLYLKDFLDESLAESIVDDGNNNNNNNNNSFGDVLSYLIEKCNEGTPVKIGNDKAFSSTGYIRDYYVNRYFRRQLINTEVLKKHHNSEVFFVRGASKNDLVELGVQEDTVCEKMDGQTSNTTIILSAKENTHESFEDICTKNPDKNIHLLEFRFPHLFWIKSKGEISTLHKNVDNYYGPLSNLKTLSEEQFIENINRKVVLLANDSGMGKSTVITNMAHRIKEKSQTTWVVRINLNDYANEKPNSLGKIDKNKNILDFLTEMIIPSSNEPLDEFQSKLFRTALDKAGKFGVVIFFDGFDEISPTYKDKTSLLLEALKNSSITQFWVTTRVHEKEDLEKLLQTPSYILCRFYNNDQKHFLERYFRWKLTFPEETLSEESRERIREHFEQSIKNIEELSKSVFELEELCRTLTAICDVFVEGPLEIAGKFLKQITGIKDRHKEHYLDFSEYIEILLHRLKAVKDSDEMFTFVPLHLKMLADIVFESKFHLPANLQLSSLYQSFVKIKFDIYHREKSVTPAGNVGAKTKDDFFSEILRKVHHELALKLIFPEEKSLPQLNKFADFENPLRNSGKDPSQELARVGFVCLREGELKFVHRSYAEYFLCEYFCENLQDEKVQGILFNKVFHERNYFLIRQMFNDRLNKYYECKFTKQNLLQDACDVNLECVISLTYFHENLYNFVYIVQTAINENHFGIILLIFEKYKDRENIIKEIFSNKLLYSLADKLGPNRNTCFETLWKKLFTSYPKILKKVLFNFSKPILTAAKRADNYVILKIILDICTNGENDLKHLIPIIKQQLTRPILSILQRADADRRLLTLLDILKHVPDLFESFFFSVEKEKGTSLIQWAVCNQRFEILHNILTIIHNSDVEKKLLLSADSSGKTLVFSVCEVEQYDIAQSLVNAASENIIEDLTVISAHPKGVGLKKSVEILIKAVSKNSKIYQNLISIQQKIPQITETTKNLHDAIKKKNVDTVKEIYSDNGDIQKHLILARSNVVHNSLELAVNYGDSETVVYFLQNFCKHDNVFRTVLTSIDHTSKTLLHKAVLSGDTEIVKAFLTDVNSDFLIQLLVFVDDEELSPFNLAILCGHHEIFKLFLEEINKKFPEILKDLVLGVNSGLAPLHLAVSNKHTNIIEDLIRFVKDNISKEVYEEMLLSTNMKKETILLQIFSMDHFETLNPLLGIIEMDILKKLFLIVDRENKNAILQAATFGNTEIFDWMKSNVGNTDPGFLKKLIETNSGSNILHCAAKYKHPEIFIRLIEFIKENAGVETLIEKMIEKDGVGKTPLVRGLLRRYPHDILIAIINTIPQETFVETLRISNTFYHFTSYHNEITKKLLEWTKENLNQECLKKLFLHTSSEGQTILIHAVLHWDSEMLQSLLETVEGEILDEMVLKVDCKGRSALSKIVLSDYTQYDIIQTFLKSTKKYCSNSIFRKMLLMAVDKRGRNFLSALASEGKIGRIEIALSVLKDEFDDLIEDLLITSVDCCNRTVLHWAYWNNRTNVVKFLLDPDLINSNDLHQKLFFIKLQLDEVKVDKETLEEAILKKDAEKIEFVFQKMSWYTTENKKEFMKSLFKGGRSLLHFAAEKADCDTFRRLMQHMDENIFADMFLELKKNPWTLKETLLKPRNLFLFSNAITWARHLGNVPNLLKKCYYEMAESVGGSDVNFDFNTEELESLAECLKEIDADSNLLDNVLKHIEINKNRI